MKSQNYQNIFSLSRFEKKSLFKQSDLLEIHQRNKSGLKYYNPNATDEEKIKSQEELYKANNLTSNNFTQACIQLHPYYSYKYKHSPYFALSMNDSYFNEEIIKDEETGKTWLLDVYKDDISKSPYSFFTLNMIIIYLSLVHLTKPGEIDYLYKSAPYFVYDYLLKNGSKLSDTYLSQFSKYKHDPDQSDFSFPDPGTDLFNLFEEIEKQNISKIDRRYFIDDDNELKSEIDSIFSKNFIEKSDIDFLEYQMTEKEKSDMMFSFLVPHLKKSTYNGDDPYGLMGSSMKDFSNTSFTFPKEEIYNKLDQIQDLQFDDIVDIESPLGGSVKITRKALEYFAEYDEDMRVVSMEEIKNYFKDVDERPHAYRFYFLDSNFKDIDVNSFSDVPEGIYTQMEKTKYGDDDKTYVLSTFIKTGDPRSLFKAQLNKKLISLCRHQKFGSTLQVAHEILNSIPEVNDPNRSEFFYNNIQKNNFFNLFLRNYSDSLESIHNPDRYYYSDYEKERVQTFIENSGDTISLMKEKLTPEEIQTIIYDETNSGTQYDSSGFQYDSNGFGENKQFYNGGFFNRHEKSRLVAQGNLVDDKFALDYFRNTISKYDTKGNQNYISGIYDIFSNSVGFSSDVSNYFKSEASKFRSISAKKGQEIFNEGLNNGRIKTKRLSDFPKALESITPLLPDFVIATDYRYQNTENLSEAIKDTPIYIVDKSWMQSEMSELGVDRLFKESGINDARGVFASYLDGINEGKPFVVIYDSFKDEELQDVRDVFNIPEERFGQTVAHEFIHRLQYTGIESGIRNRYVNPSREYGDPWLEKPEEIEAIVYGNIPYIYGIILSQISTLINSGDDTLVDTLVEHLVNETQKIEAYQIDKIYDSVDENSKKELIQKSYDDKKYELKTMSEFIRGSIYDVDLKSINEEDKQTYIKEISDNLLQIVMTKWMSQFHIDYTAGILSGTDEFAEKMALQIRQEFEAKRHEELSQQPEDKSEYVDPYQTYGRESLQRLIREFPENEKEFFEQLKQDPEYQGIIQSISSYLHNTLNPEDPQDRQKMNIWFFDNGELKIPYSLDGLIKFFDNVKNEISTIDNYTVSKLQEKIKKYIEARDKYNKYENSINEMPPDKERYEADELHELVNLLVDMYTNYGPGWIWTAKNNWSNITQLSRINRYLMRTSWSLN